MGQKRQLMRVWAPELGLSAPNTAPKNLALFRFSSFNGRGWHPTCATRVQCFATWISRDKVLRFSSTH